MNVSFAKLTLLVPLILNCQTIFGAQNPVEQKEAKKVIASTHTILESMQKFSLDNNAKQSEAIRLATKNLNEAVDAVRLEADNLLSDLHANNDHLKKALEIVKAQQLNDHQKQQIVLPSELKSQELSTQYDECMYTMLSLFLSEDNQDVVAGLSEDNKKLRRKQLSYDTINKRLRSAATANAWGTVRFILCNKYAKTLVSTRAINALFLFAVFNGNSIIINDILQSQTLADQLTKTTLSFAYTCAKIRKNNTLMDIIETNAAIKQQYGNNIQDIDVEKQSKVSKNDVEYKNLEELSAILDDTNLDDTDLEVLAAHKGLLDF